MGRFCKHIFPTTVTPYTSDILVLAGVYGLIKLLVLDLDGTVWDHPDASSLQPPYTRLNDDVAVDSQGVRVTLTPGVRWFLERVYGRVALAVCSWNKWENAFELLKTFGLHEFFGYLGIEPHPHKYRVFEKIIKWYRDTYGEDLRAEEILYVDDRRIHLEDIYRYIGNVRFIQMGVDVKDFYELYEHIKNDLKPG